MACSSCSHSHTYLQQAASSPQQQQQQPQQQPSQEQQDFQPDAGAFTVPNPLAMQMAQAAEMQNGIRLSPANDYRRADAREATSSARSGRAPPADWLGLEGCPRLAG
jgi:hypothetical protein